MRGGRSRYPNVNAANYGGPAYRCAHAGYACFSFIYCTHNVGHETKEGNVMSDVANCRAMELLCRERATADPSHSGKWLGQARRWRELEQRETAWQLQRRNGKQQMYAGPMAMGPNPVASDLRNKQQG
jgi:hypothetical protein